MKTQTEKTATTRNYFYYNMGRLLAPLIALPIAVGITSLLDTSRDLEVFLEDKPVKIVYVDSLGARKSYIEATEFIERGKGFDNKGFMYLDKNADGTLDEFKISGPKYYSQTNHERNYIIAESDLIPEDKKERYRKIYLKLEDELRRLNDENGK